MPTQTLEVLGDISYRLSLLTSFRCNFFVVVTVALCCYWLQDVSIWAQVSIVCYITPAIYQHSHVIFVTYIRIEDALLKTCSLVVSRRSTPSQLQTSSRLMRGTRWWSFVIIIHLTGLKMSSSMPCSTPLTAGTHVTQLYCRKTLYLLIVITLLTCVRLTTCKRFKKR